MPQYEPQKAVNTLTSLGRTGKEESDSVAVQVVLPWNRGRHTGLPLLFSRSDCLNRIATDEILW